MDSASASEAVSTLVTASFARMVRLVNICPGYLPNVEALKAAQPKDLDASEIEVRLGATWIDPSYIRKFMWETFETPFYQQRINDGELFRLHRRVEHQEQERGQLQQYCRIYDLRHGARKRL